MEISRINGLPAHVLLVHAAVVFVPVCALALLAVVGWPAARQRLALPTAVLATLTMVLVKLTADAGEWLEHQLGGGSPATRTHTELGAGMLPWSIGVALTALAWWALFRRPAKSPAWRAMTVAVGVLAVVAAVGSAVQVYRVGDSGARAVWSQTQ